MHMKKLCLIIFSLGFTLCYAPAALAENPVPADGMNFEHREAQAERFRLRHRLEYENPEASVLREAAKAAEKEVVDARQAFEDYARLHAPEIGRLNKEMRREHEESVELRARIGAIRREIALAAGQIDNTDTAARLAQELEGAEKQSSDYRQRLGSLTSQLNEVKAALVTNDPEAAALQADLVVKEGAHQQAMDRLNFFLDAHPDVVEFDAQRRQSPSTETE